MGYPYDDRAPEPFGSTGMPGGNGYGQLPEDPVAADAADPDEHRDGAGEQAVPAEPAPAAGANGEGADLRAPAPRMRWPILDQPGQPPGTSWRNGQAADNPVGTGRAVGQAPPLREDPPPPAPDWPAEVPYPGEVDGYSPPTIGWRWLLYLILFGLVSIQPSAREAMQRLLAAQIYRMEELDVLASGARIIVLQSQKGGQGKTTVSLLLGMVFKLIWSHLGVIDVDGNPDRGTLRDIIPPIAEVPMLDGQEISPTAIGLFSYMTDKSMREIVHSELLLKFLRVADQGVLALPLAMSNAEAKKVSKPQFTKLIETLRKFLQVLIIDLGTGFRESTSDLAFNLGHLVVLVTTPKPADLNVALDNFGAMLEDHPALARKAILVVNMAGPETDLEAIRAHFAYRFGVDFTGVQGDPDRPGVPVLAIPFSDYIHQGRVHIEPGSGREVRSPVIYFDELEPLVRAAAFTLGEAVGERMATREDGTLAINPLAVHRNTGTAA